MQARHRAASRAKRGSPPDGGAGRGSAGGGSVLNRQSQLNPFDNLTISLDWTWLKVSVYGELNANRLRYSDAAEQNTTQWNNRFGAEGELTRGRFVVKTQIYERMYRGYTIEAMNRNMLVWDASVTWKILKNKAKLTLEVDDILNNKDHKYYTQTAYQQTTSWSDFRHTCHSWSPGNVLKVIASPDCCIAETAFWVGANRGSSVPTEI